MEHDEVALQRLKNLLKGLNEKMKKFSYPFHEEFSPICDLLRNNNFAIGHEELFKDYYFVYKLFRIDYTTAEIPDSCKQLFYNLIKKKKDDKDVTFEEFKKIFDDLYEKKIVQNIYILINEIMNVKDNNPDTMEPLISKFIEILDTKYNLLDKFFGNIYIPFWVQLLFYKSENFQAQIDDILKYKQSKTGGKRRKTRRNNRRSFRRVTKISKRRPAHNSKRRRWKRHARANDVVH